MWYVAGVWLQFVAVYLAGCYAEDCALCGKAIPAGKGVHAQIGRDKRAYRCIHCALTHLASERNQYFIIAKSSLDGRAIRLTHKNGQWSQEPKAAVFLILPERADECLDLHQPFASKAEFDRYLRLHPGIAKQKPKAYTIADYEKILRAGKPGS